MLLLGCNRLITLGVTAVCDDTSGYQICGSFATPAVVPVWIKADLIVLNIAQLTEEESMVRFGAAREHFPSLPLVLVGDRAGAVQGESRPRSPQEPGKYKRASFEDEIGVFLKVEAL